MKKNIWITRHSASSIQCGGLTRINVWFVEPCVTFEINHDAFSEEASETHDKLKGILFGHQTKENYRWHKADEPDTHIDVPLSHGGKEIDQKIYDMVDSRDISPDIDNFGSGNVVHHRPNNAVNIFGYDSPIAVKIWKLICNEFDDPNAERFIEWDQIEKEQNKKYYTFCKKLEIEIL